MKQIVFVNINVCYFTINCGDDHITSILSGFLFTASTERVASVISDAGVVRSGRVVVFARMALLDCSDDGLFHVGNLSLYAHFADLPFVWGSPFRFVLLPGVHDDLLISIGHFLPVGIVTGPNGSVRHMDAFALGCERGSWTSSASDALGLNLATRVCRSNLAIELVVWQCRHVRREVIGTLGKCSRRVLARGEAKVFHSALQLRMFDFLQEVPDLRLFRDRLSFRFEYIEHSLELIQKVGKGESLLVLVMQSIAVAFRNRNAPTSIAFATVVVPEGSHVSSAILMLGKWFDPLLCRLGLEVTLQELVNSPGIGLVVGTRKWCTRNSLFVEVGVFGVRRWFFSVAYDVA